MNDPEPVCFFENVANLRGDIDCCCKRKTAMPCGCLRQCFTLDKLHHDEVTAVRQISGVEDHRGVWMAQLRHRSRFAQKAIGDVSVSREFRSDDLDCDGAFEIQMGGKVNSAHAAGPNLAFYSESASDKLGDIHMTFLRVKGRNAFGFGMVRGKRRALV